MQQICSDHLPNIRQQRQGQHSIGLMLRQGDASLPPVNIGQVQGNDIDGAQPGKRPQQQHRPITPSDDLARVRRVRQQHDLLNGQHGNMPYAP